MKDSLYKELVEIRKYLHQNPELSGKERKTSEYIKEKLHQLAPDNIISFRNYGVVAHFKGTSNAPAVLVRGDFDALPIIETNDFEHKSIFHNISHKCGHDGHAAIVMGLCYLLKEERLSGDVYALFQPAEETGKGAMGMIKGKKFKHVNAEYAVALHNLPGYPINQLICRKGNFTAAANSMIIRLRGKTSHAAEPENGINPALAMAEITQQFANQNQVDDQKDDFRLITPVYTCMGEKSYGVSAGYGELHFTLRAFSNRVMEALENDLQQIAAKIGEDHNLKIDFDWTEKFAASENNEEVYKAIKKSAETLDLPFLETKSPFKFGEDFGAFTEKMKGAMFCIGAGEDHSSLHNPDYDFPDALLKTCPGIFLNIIKELQFVKQLQH